tara:strand:+ start:420 stop:1094 length:675 start_codon:yes stop_codon:yes gene_type:complete
MLRPKKKITKKEIKRDPFLETVDQAQAHLEENRSRYLQIGIAILAILIGFNVLTKNSQKANEEASSSLGDALLTLDLNDQTTAKFQLETVVNEYENTTSASIAEYYLGKMSYDNNDNVNAERYLYSYLNDNPKGFLASSAGMILADIAVSKKEFDKGLAILSKCIKNSKSIKDIRQMQLRKADYHISNGQKIEAEEIIDKLLLDEDLGSWNKQVAQEIKGKILS